MTGEVTLKLFKGSLRAVGRTSPHGLYNHALSTYGGEDRFDHRAAEGFITPARAAAPGVQPGSTAEATSEHRRLRRGLGGSPAPARGARLLQLAAARPAALARGPDRVPGAPDHALAHGHRAARRRRGTIRDGAGARCWRTPAGTLSRDEEDVHMAVEAELLARELGETAGMLHTAPLAQRSGGARSAAPRPRAVRAGARRSWPA